jgi:hypothetical protein
MTKGGFVTDLILMFLLVAAGAGLVEKPVESILGLTFALFFRFVVWSGDIAVAECYEPGLREIMKRSAKAKLEVDLIASTVVVAFGAMIASCLVP